MRCKKILSQLLTDLEKKILEPCSPFLFVDSLNSPAAKPVTNICVIFKRGIFVIFKLRTWWALFKISGISLKFSPRIDTWKFSLSSCSLNKISKNASGFLSCSQRWGQTIWRGLSYRLTYDKQDISRSL